MLKGMQVQRKAEVRGNNVKLRYIIEKDGASHGIFNQGGTNNGKTGVLNHLLAYELAKDVFPSLTEREVVEAFGEFYFPDGTWLDSGGYYYSIVATYKDKNVITQVHRAIFDWLRRGIEAAAALEERRGLERWLWEEATFSLDGRRVG